ncbi:hypothetical protein STEG23_029709 [Scotinomys teguina]
MFLTTLYFALPLLDLLLSAEVSGGDRLDCVRASDQCLKEQSCSTKYRTLRQCVAGKETNFSLASGLEAKDECRNAMEALKQKSLYNCRCKRGMKKEKNCLRIYWSMYQSLQDLDCFSLTCKDSVLSSEKELHEQCAFKETVVKGLRWGVTDRLALVDRAKVEPQPTHSNSIPKLICVMWCRVLIPIELPLGPAEDADVAQRVRQGPSAGGFARACFPITMKHWNYMAEICFDRFWFSRVPLFPDLFQAIRNAHKIVG